MYILIATCALLSLYVGIRIFFKRRAILMCRSLGQRFYNYDDENGDALVQFEIIRLKLNRHLIIPPEIGFHNIHNLAELAYTTFCRHMTMWRRQHQELEEKILAIREFPESVFVAEAMRLGPTLASSQEHLWKLEADASEFYETWIQRTGSSPSLERLK